MSATAIAIRPYIGLRYFEERDAHLFYGRDEHVAELLGKLAERRFVAVLGSSGCGKSSVVRAGLLPELRSGMIPKAGPRWKVVEFKPGRDPLGELADAVRSSLGVRNARELVKQGPLGIARAVAQARIEKAEAGPDKTNILVIADQFEEVFRFQREESAQGRGVQAAEQCHALARRLLDAAAQPELPIYVLLAMRSDYLGECAQFPDLPEKMSESLYLVPRLRRDQLQEAITAPVGSAIDSAVVQRLLSEVGSDADQLPRLQHLLGRMWDRASGGRLTMAHYEAAGAWENGLRQHLDEVYGRLTPAQQTACQRVFQQLSELDKGRAVRRRAEASELLAVCGSEAGAVIAAFRSEGFLTARADPVDITHESILREWPRVGEWLEREQRDARRLQELAEAAKDAGWRADLHDKQRTQVRGLEGLTLQNLSAWREESKPTAAWARRYLTAVDFETADDYLTWSQALDRQRKGRVRRLERLVLALVLLVAVALGGAVLVFRQEREAALDNAKEAKASEHKAQQTLDKLTKAQEDLQGSFAAQQDLTRDARAGELAAYAGQLQTQDPTLALYLGLQAGRAARTPPRGLEAVLATALTNGAGYRIFRGPAQAAAVAWSPDGKTLASADGDGKIRLWPTVGGGPPRTVEVERGQLQVDQLGAKRAMAWSPDGRMLASGIGAGVGLWDAASGQQLRTLYGQGSVVKSIAWSPDSKTLATSTDFTTLWDVASGRVLFTRSSGGSGLAWSPDGKTVASWNDTETVTLFDPASGQPLRSLSSGQPTGSVSRNLVTVTGVVWSRGGNTLASADSDNTIRLWDPLSGGSVRRTLEGHQGSLLNVAWSPDGTTLASGSDNGTVHLWTANDGRMLRTFNGHQASVQSIAWSLDGKLLASASSDGTIRLWDVQADQSLRTLHTTGSVSSLAWSPDGKTLASGGADFAGADRMVHIWSASTGQSLRTVPSGQGTLYSILSPDGKTLASAGNDNTIRLWDADSGQQIRVLQGHERLVTYVAWSPDGKLLASASGDTVRLWQPSSGQSLRILRGHPSDVEEVAWSPDGKLLASSSFDGTVVLWRASSGQLLHKLDSQGAVLVLSLAWSPDGKTIAAAGDDRIIRLWQTETGLLLRTIESHQDWIFGLAYSPDGKTLGSASRDRTIRLWDAATGQPVRTLEGHGNPVSHIAWSPDGQMLASASDDSTIRLWPGTAAALLNQVRNRLRLFTPSSDECQRYFGSPSCPPVR